MKNILARISYHKYFIFFILLFSYVQSIYIRISDWQEINLYVFTPEAPFFYLIKVGLLYVVSLSYLKYFLKNKNFKTNTLLTVFFLLIVTYLILMQLVGLMTAVLFDTVERNFNTHTFFFNLFSDFLDGFIYGGFLLTYYYFNANKHQQEQLSSYQQALSESKIKQLKSQLNPHFLFNNLNVLDQLIAEDKDKASNFLNEFADIYRYIIQTSDKKIIAISEELKFIGQYFVLIQHKYEEAYQLRIQGEIKDVFIVPMTLQLLVENAIKHNLGTKDAPIYINIKLNDAIVVSNNVRLKINNAQKIGAALSNLKEQYRLLADQRIEVVQTAGLFSVTVPAIKDQAI